MNVQQIAIVVTVIKYVLMNLEPSVAIVRLDLS